MARKRKDRESDKKPEERPAHDLRPAHREQTRETRGPRSGYWQVGGASRTAIKRLKKP